MFKVKKPAPDARILRIREYEDKLQSMQGKVAEQVRPKRSCVGRPLCGIQRASSNCAACWDELA